MRLSWWSCTDKRRVLIKDALGASRGMSHTLRCAQRALALR
jgi:hypothetical protein